MTESKGMRGVFALLALASTALACSGGAASHADVVLIALRVTASAPTSGSPPVALIPPFSPGIHDYYVRCAAGTNTLTVAMTASSGAESVVLQPTKSPSVREQTLKLKVNEGDAVVAAATDGTATAEYWVRCLPHDFPTMKMVAHADAGAPTPGYYLVGNTSIPTGEGAYAIVLDGNGVPIWYDRASSSAWNVDAVVAGAISFIDPTTDRSYEVHHLDPLETTFVSVGGVPATEHELRVLSNGDYLVFFAVEKTGVDLTGLEIPFPNGAVESFGPNSAISDCTIQEIDAKGNIVWSWDAMDHFDPVKDMTYLDPPGDAPGQGLVQPYHCNSIDVDTNGNLLVSARHMDSVFYIEKSTGKVLWKMGGAKASKDQATYIPVADAFYRQHDARFQKNWVSTCSGRSGSGQISLFDDETAAPGPARAVIYDVNVGASGCGGTDAAAVPSATVAWQYKGTTSIGQTGSFRVAAEGGGVIGWGTNAGFVFSEVDVHKHDLLDFYFTDGSSSYRAIKVALTTFDPDLLRATAGQGGTAFADAGKSGASKGDASSTDDATADADTGSNRGVACYLVSGSGLAAQCSYSSSTSTGFDCASLAGSIAGSCPSSGLYGCCVETVPADGGGQVTTATCYYSAEQDASTQCELAAHGGGSYVWQTFAP